MCVKSDEQLILCLLIMCLHYVVSGSPPSKKKSNQIVNLFPDINTWHYRSMYITWSIYWHEDYIIGE